MGNSFQDQLLKLGLVDKKKVREVKNEKHKNKKDKGKKGSGQLSLAEENALLVKQAAEKKRAKDLQLNRQRDAKLQKRAEMAQIKQLIEQHKVAKDERGNPYRFNVCGKIHRIFVDSKTADQLGSGVFGIVEMVGAAGQFEVVPRDVVEKIRAINGKIFTTFVDTSQESSAKESDDPYADYVVPDDLMW